MSYAGAAQVGYLFFLLMMSYTVLVDMPRVPSWPECYAIAYVFTLLFEKMREVRNVREISKRNF